MTRQVFPEKRRAEIRKMASALSARFTWASTPQGHTYWRTVQDNMLEIAAYEHPHCPNCGQEIQGD